MFLDRFAPMSSIVATRSYAVVFGKHFDRVPAPGGAARRTPGSFVAWSSNIIAGRDDADDAQRNALPPDGPSNEAVRGCGRTSGGAVVPWLKEETRDGLCQTLKEVDQPWR